MSLGFQISRCYFAMKPRSPALTLEAYGPSASSNEARYKSLCRHDRKVLKRSKRMMIRSINSAGHFIDACLSFDVFTSTDAEFIKAERGNSKDRVKQMLKRLERKPISATCGFLQALKETHQQHIVDALCGNDENLMSEFHRKALKDCRHVLVKNITPEGGLLDALISTEAITLTDAELIRTEKRNWERQVDLLVECLLRRPDTAFDGFIKALLLTHQQHVANDLLEGGLQVSVRLNLKRKRSDDEPEPSTSNELPAEADDIRATIDRLLKDALNNISDMLEARRKGQKMATADPDGYKLEYVEKLVELLQHFFREVLSVEMGSIVVRVLCLSRESAWDLRSLCRSEDFLAVCRSALIPKEHQSVVDVEVTLDESSFGRCLTNLDKLFPPPPSPLGDVNPLPLEILHRILHETLSAREVGQDVRIEDLSEVCELWMRVLSDDWFHREHKRFIEASMRPYLFVPLLLETEIVSPADKPKPIIGVGIIERLLYIARAETPSIEVFNIPDISSTDLDSSIVPDHVLVRTLNVPPLEMPFNMAASAQSRCLYLTDFSQNVGCVWRVTPEGTVTKFADGVGRPIGISVSRDNYVIVVSETPNCLRVFSRLGERVLEMRLDFEAPRQAVCLEPGRFALIHGYLEATNRVVELDSSGHVLRCYGSTIGDGMTQIHWPAALIHDARGRMLVGDRENRRVHLVQRDFRLRRHLVQLDRTSVARPRRLCIDDLNGTLYIGQTDPTVKVYRIADPLTPHDRDKLLVEGINCFGASKMDNGKATEKPGEEVKGDTAEAAEGAKRKFLLPRGEYSRTENLNDLPVNFLQKILLKTMVLNSGPRKAMQQNLATVCRKWKDIVAVMHFKYILDRCITARKAAAKERMLEAVESQE